MWFFLASQFLLVVEVINEIRLWEIFVGGFCGSLFCSCAELMPIGFVVYLQQNFAPHVDESDTDD